MTLSFNVLLTVCLAYVALLFAVAAISEQRANRGEWSFLRSPVIYTLSISVYCTAWTFYGSVGRAASGGLEFLTIYLGPTLMFTLGWVVLRKMIRISKVNRITSIADFISSRYGKSTLLSGVVTVIAVVGIMPYISLQLKAVSTSFTMLLQYPDIVMPHAIGTAPVLADTAFWIAAARLYSPQAVGTGSATVALMMLLSTVAQLNLVQGLARFLPRLKRGRRAFICVAYAVCAGLAVAVVAGLYAVVDGAGSPSCGGAGAGCPCGALFRSIHTSVAIEPGFETTTENCCADALPSTMIDAAGSPKPGMGRPQSVSSRNAARPSTAPCSRHSTSRGHARQATTSRSRAPSGLRS